MLYRSKRDGCGFDSHSRNAIFTSDCGNKRKRGLEFRYLNYNILKIEMKVENGVS